MATRVRFLQGMGRSRGPAIAAGTVADVSDDEAERLIKKAIAEPAKGAAVSPIAAGADKAKAAKRSGTASSRKATRAPRRS